MIKSAIIAEIDSKIRNASLVDQVELADTVLKILDSEYNITPVDETSATSVILTPTSDTYFPYQLRLTKQGGQVTIQGRIGNSLGLVPSPPNLPLLTFKNNEFLPKNDFTYWGKITNDESESDIFITVDGDDVKLFVRYSIVGAISGTPNWYTIRQPLIYNTAG